MTDSAVTQNLDARAPEAGNAFFDPLTEWRDEVAASTERYSETVLDKMVTAATAMGWPQELVEASRMHLVQASKMQMQLINQLMDAWQTQIKSPMPSQFAAHLRPFSGMGFGQSYERSGPANGPFQFWMKAAETWQHNWVSAFSMWANQGPGKMPVRERAARRH
jgi:hypothetical protein